MKQAGAVPTTRPQSRELLGYTQERTIMAHVVTARSKHRFFRHISLSHAEERLNHFHSTFPRPQDPAEASMPFWGCQLGQGVETEQVWGRRGWNMVEGRGNNTLAEGQSRSTGSLCGCLWPPGVPLGIQEAWAWALWPFKLKGKASYLTGCCEGSISARGSPQGSPPTIYLLLWLQHLDFLCVL